MDNFLCKPSDYPDAVDEAKLVVLDNPWLLSDYNTAKYCAFRGIEGPLCDFWNGYDEFIVHACKTLSNARYSRSKRVRSKSEKIVMSGKAKFLTLTFNDETLAKTTKEQRRRMVQRFLKRNCDFYIANIDFGSKEKNPESRGREHYHALVVSDHINLDQWSGLLRKDGSKRKGKGWIQYELVKSLDRSPKCLAKYITKLTKHALKESTKASRLQFQRIIYSRNTEGFIMALSK